MRARAELDRGQRLRPGCVILRRARSTGTVVGLYRGKEAGLDTDGGRAPWATICEGPDGESHGGVVSHETRALAEGWLSNPDVWCPHCLERKR